MQRRAVALARPIVLFGPHGVGRAARLRCMEGPTFDLSVVPPVIRSHLAQGAASPESPLLSFEALSAADLALHHFPTMFYRRVVLLPPREIYLARRREQDVLLPHRSSQADNYYQFLKTAALYDEVWDD